MSRFLWFSVYVHRIGPATYRCGASGKKWQHGIPFHTVPLPAVVYLLARVVQRLIACYVGKAFHN